jgi:hypothetical protein
MLWRCVGLRRRWPGPHDRVMARTVSTVITDDIDGSPGAATVSFGLDGASYEIDLTAANKARLRGHWRRSSRRPGRPASGAGPRAGLLRCAPTARRSGRGHGRRDWLCPIAAGSAPR